MVVKRLPRIVVAYLPAVALLLQMVACVKTAPQPKEREESRVEEVARKVPKFTADISAIHIFDDRTDTAVPGRLLHMPEWTIVGQEDEFAPVLNDDHRDVIRHETRGYFVPSERTVTVEIYVLDGKQTFKVGERTETITMTFALRIEISDEIDTHDVRTAEGRASLTEEALDITYEQVNELYAGAIRESVRNAFERMRLK